MFRGFAVGSALALGTAGIINGRALAGSDPTFPAGLGGLQTAFFASIMMFAGLHFLETCGLAQLDEVLDEDVLTVLRWHLMLGLGFPWLIGGLMIFLASVM